MAVPMSQTIERSASEYEQETPAPERKRFAHGSSSSGAPLLPIYLREMGATPLLTREGELKLSTQLQQSRRRLVELIHSLPPTCKEYVLEVVQANPEDVAWTLEQLERVYRRLQGYAIERNDPAITEASARAKRIKRELDEARDAMIVANLRLVTHIVKKYGNQGIPFMDLIQEGNIGLMKAVEKFEPERGYKFSTYAYWWIKQAITRAIADKARMIRIPVHVSEKIRKLNRVISSMAETLGRRPTAREIAKKMRCSQRKVEELLAIVQDPLSLENFGADDETAGALPFVADPNASSPIDTALDRELREKMRAALKVLDNREEEIIRLRFGIGRQETYTLEEIGKVVNLSRERVRQIENIALRKIRSTQQTKSLRKHLVAR